MSSLSLAMEEVQSRFGMSTNKASSLLSGLISFITQQSGGISGFVDRFKSAGFGDQLSSWITGSAHNLSTDQVENLLGKGTVSSLAAKAGLTVATATPAIGLILPKLLQSLAPGGVVSKTLPSELSTYCSGPLTIDAGAPLEYTSRSLGNQKRANPILWPLLAILAALVVGLWIWLRGNAPAPAFDSTEEVRIAAQRASAALAALKPGFTANDLIAALNLDVINFSSSSATIPPEGTDFLNQAAAAMRSMPAFTTLEIGGHTDNTGDPASNLQLSQQRADAVRTYLIARGVDPAVLIAKGYGDTRPVASNDTEEGKFRNRRIEFTVVK